MNLPTERKVDSSKLKRSWCNPPRNLLQNLLATHPRNLGGTFRRTFWPPKMNLPQRTFPRLRKQCCLKTLANWQERPQSCCCFFLPKKRSSNIRGPKSCGPSLQDDGDYCLRIRRGCDVQHLHLEIHVESQAHHLSREASERSRPKTVVNQGHHATVHLKRRGKTCVSKPAKRNNSCFKQR